MASKSLAISQSSYSYSIWKCSVSMHVVMLMLDCRSWLLTPDWAFKLHSPFSWEQWPWTHTHNVVLDWVVSFFFSPCPSIDDRYSNCSTISNSLISRFLAKVAPALFAKVTTTMPSKSQNSPPKVYDSIWDLDLQSMGLCFSCLPD